jgi:hypothetical protein
VAIRGVGRVTPEEMVRQDLRVRPRLCGVRTTMTAVVADAATFDEQLVFNFHLSRCRESTERWRSGRPISSVSCACRQTERSSGFAN